MSPVRTPTKAATFNRMAKQVRKATAMLTRMQARVTELEAENATLKEHCSQQDTARRTVETKHSSELLLILDEIRARR